MNTRQASYDPFEDFFVRVIFTSVAAFWLFSLLVQGAFSRTHHAPMADSAITVAASFGPAFTNGALAGLILHAAVLGFNFAFLFVVMSRLQQKFAHTSSVMLSAQILGNVAMIIIFTLHRFGVSSFYYIEPTTGKETEFYFLLALAVFWASSNYSNFFNIGVMDASPAIDNITNESNILMSYSWASLAAVVSFVWVLFGAGIALYRPTEWAFGMIALAVTIVYLYLLMVAYRRLRVHTKKRKAGSSSGTVAPISPDDKNKRTIARIFQYAVILRNLLVAVVILVIFCLGPALGGQIPDADLVLIAYTVCVVVVGALDVIVFYLTNVRRSRSMPMNPINPNANAVVSTLLF